MSPASAKGSYRKNASIVPKFFQRALVLLLISSSVIGNANPECSNLFSQSVHTEMKTVQPVQTDSEAPGGVGSITAASQTWWQWVVSWINSTPLGQRMKKLPLFREKEPKSPMAPEPKIIAFLKNAVKLMSARRRTVPPSERNPDFLNDHAFIKEQKYAGNLGKMGTHFDRGLDTRLFYSVTARPNPDGSIPVVDPSARALFIYIHGSGTQKASGLNFAYKGNDLAQMGYAILSFDLPYHFDGPRGRHTLSSDWFMKWLNQIIEQHRVPGQPVILAGHSFGPDVIAEYIKRYPHGADGALLISPAAFTPELDRWFYKHTSQAAKFWGDTRPNHDGSRWGGMATAGFTWNKPVTAERPDPTIVNPDLNVRIMSGKWEEYFPGPVDEHGIPAKADRTFDVEAAMRPFFSRATFVLEPDVGHYIFMKTDESGVDVVTRELLAMAGKTPADIKQLRTDFNARKLSEVDTLAQRYSREPLFHKWVDATYGADTILKLVQSQDLAEARAIAKDFQNVMKQRDAALYDNIRNTRVWAPRFYAENESAIGKLGQKGTDAGALVNRYLDLLETLSVEERVRVASVDPSVLAPPARPVKPEHLPQQTVVAVDPEKSGVAGTASTVLGGLAGLPVKDQLGILRDSSGDEFVAGISTLSLDGKLKLLRAARTGKIITSDGHRVDEGILRASQVLVDAIAAAPETRSRLSDELKVILFLYQLGSGRVSTGEQDRLKAEAFAVLMALGVHEKKISGLLDPRPYEVEVPQSPDKNPAAGLPDQADAG